MVKYRKGFVTNSSSSCYICQISGEECSGMDISLSQCNMTQCQNGHVFRDEYLLDFEIAEQDMLDLPISKSEAEHANYVTLSIKDPEHQGWGKWTLKELAHLTKLKRATSIGEFIDDYDNLIADEGVDPKRCPICQLNHILDEDMLTFTLSVNGLDKDAVAESMRKFANLNELFASLK